MSGAVSVVRGSSSVVEPKTCAASACLPSCNLSGGDLIPSIGRKHVAAPRLELSTPFLDNSSIKAFCWAPNNLKKRRKMSVVALGGLGGQYEDNFEDVKTVILSFPLIQKHISFLFFAIFVLLSRVDISILFQKKN